MSPRRCRVRIVVMTRSYSLTLLVLSVAIAIMSPSLVFADPCAVQLGYPIVPAVYANTIVTVIVPLSATCSTSYGNQLYANANAYDLNSNTSADSVNTILTSVNGGYTFTGQLGFNLPASTQGHWVQIAVSIYSSQAGDPVTTSGEAFQVNAGTVQVITMTITQQSSVQYAPDAPGAYPRPRFIFGFVAIAAILATVIIVTVGLIVYSRKQPGYYPIPRGY